MVKQSINQGSLADLLEDEFDPTLSPKNSPVYMSQTQRPSSPALSSVSSSSSSSSSKPVLTPAGTLARPYFQQVGPLTFQQPAGAQPMSFTLGTHPAHPRTSVGPSPQQQRVKRAAHIATSSQHPNPRPTQELKHEDEDVFAFQAESESSDEQKKKKKARTSKGKKASSSSTKKGRPVTKDVGAIGQCIKKKIVIHTI
jgi:hypothetical protein